MCSMDIVRGAAAIATFGTSELAIYGVDKALEALNPPAEMVNYRGDKLTDQDKRDLDVVDQKPDPKAGIFSATRARDPKEKAQMLLNWLNGTKPHAPDPGQIFGEADAFSTPHAKAAAGAGVGGLFGMGLLVGDLVPKMSPIEPGADGGPGMDPQKGVPYSRPPLPTYKQPDERQTIPGGGN